MEKKNEGKQQVILELRVNKFSKKKMNKFFIHYVSFTHLHKSRSGEYLFNKNYFLLYFIKKRKKEKELTSIFLLKVKF